MPDPIQVQNLSAQPTPNQVYRQAVLSSGLPESSLPPEQPPQPAPAPTQDATPSPEEQAAVAQTAKHTAIGQMFSKLVNDGSGSAASNFWRSLVGGAVAGMGAAQESPVVARGPYGDVRDGSLGGKASRAFNAGKTQQQQQEDRQRQQSQQDAEEKRRNQEAQNQMDDLTLKKAANARAQIESIQRTSEHEKYMQRLDLDLKNGNFDLVQRAAQAAQGQVNFYNALQDVGATPLAGPDGQPLQYQSLDEAEKAAHANPKFFIGDFKTRTAYDPTTNSYGVYRVPDTDIKNITLKDDQGVSHTIPRMTASEYLDFKVKTQNLQKTKLETTKIGAEIKRIQDDFKNSGLYGNALKELSSATGKDGNVDLDKVSAGSRMVLTDHSAKGLEDVSRARTAANAKLQTATMNGDIDAIDEAKDEIASLQPLAKHYSYVLNTLTGKQPKPASAPPANPALSPNAKTAVDAISHIPKEQQAGQIDASAKLTPAEKQAAKQALGLK